MEENKKQNGVPKTGQTKVKTHVAFATFNSIYEVVEFINGNNDNYPDEPILKEDIAMLNKENGVYTLLYYV